MVSNNKILTKSYCTESKKFSKAAGALLLRINDFIYVQFGSGGGRTAGQGPLHK